MTKAYILIDTAPGAGPKVVGSLKGIQGVQAAYRVTGPHDAVAVIETADLESLAELLEERVRRLSGVQKTTTCIVVAGSSRVGRGR
ncbi:MAG: Lrp/AsnC ligand binding domain-containing protein [Chloroflexi bacterium]|nr:Lrp/AsnC ligand binding domain-containing protein [Chloroflexota bacterium]